MAEVDLIYDNLLELINSRGLIVSKSPLKERQKKYVDYYNVIDTDKLYIIYIKNNVNTEKKNDMLKDLLFDALTNVKKSIMMVIENKLSHTISNKIKGLINQSYVIEVILHRALLFNFVTNNVNKYTKYIKMSDVEIEKHLEFYNIKRNSLPYICEDDMACIWYGFERNDIIKIESPSNTNVITTDYRLVTADHSLSSYRVFLSNNLKYSTILEEEKLNNAEKSESEEESNEESEDKEENSDEEQLDDLIEDVEDDDSYDEED